MKLRTQSIFPGIATGCLPKSVPCDLVFARNALRLVSIRKDAQFTWSYRECRYAAIPNVIRKKHRAGVRCFPYGNSIMPCVRGRTDDDRRPGRSAARMRISLRNYFFIFSPARPRFFISRMISSATPPFAFSESPPNRPHVTSPSTD